MRSSRLTILAMLLLPGCATVIDGTTQTVTVRTAPVGANCSLQRNGLTVGTILATPGTVAVHREKQDITAVCQKRGWATAVTTLPSRFTAVTVGNIFAGGLIGVVVDEATRANYRYDEDTTILLTPQTAASLPSS